MRLVVIVATLFVFAPAGGEGQTVQDYLGWSEERRMGYVQGWVDGVYHASAHEDVLEPDFRSLPGGGSVGMPRVVPDGYLDFAQCHDNRWEYLNVLVADLATYLRSRLDLGVFNGASGDRLGTNVARFFREACSDFR